MKFDFAFPTRLISGERCLAENRALLAQGRHAFVVTGRTSARRAGVLDDLLPLLEEQGIAYTLFSEITENPPILTCHAGGQAAHAAGADFVIGIGGGSPLDAAKAIAAYAANPGIAPTDIYDPEKRVNPSLPLLAIPTTAGTGSEANAYSVLTLADGRQKKTFTAPDSWPCISFLDPRYLASMPAPMMVSCALDAFAHAIESYLSPKSTVLSEQLALWAAGQIWPILAAEPDAYTAEQREALLYAATAAGIAISITGTGFPHPLGYSLTLLDGIPHGRACAVFDGDYITYNSRTEVGAARLAVFAAAAGTDPDTLARELPRLSAVSFRFTEEEIAERVELIAGAKNYTNSPYVLSREEIYTIYRSHFAETK